MDRKSEWNVGYWLAAIALFLPVQMWWSEGSRVKPCLTASSKSCWPTGVSPRS